MNHLLKNNQLKITVADRGAELQSVTGSDGTEYLWNGDPAYWDEHAPILFPFCGRFWKGLATVDGVPCDPGMHGFLRFCDLSVKEQSDDRIVFQMTENEQTLAKYPFAFRVEIAYRLCENRLEEQITVENTGNRPLPFGLGLHPGFRVPFAGGSMEDYRVRFPEKSNARQIVFDDSGCFLTGKTIPAPLIDGDHCLISDTPFYLNSAFFTDMPRAVILENTKNGRSVSITCPDFPYIGFWKAAGANFLCMEPWDGLPATFGEITDLYTKKDLTLLAPNETKIYQITFAFR